MSIFSEMAIEARNDSWAKTTPSQAPRQEPQASIPAKPQPTEQAPAPKPAPDEPVSNKTAEQRLAAMSDQDAAMFSINRVRTDTERLTRRNMKECVSEHVQGICRENPDFARQVLHPRKSIVRCFRYIYRKAQEYAKQEMKDMGDEAENGVYALDIPDGLCYQWAEAYFKDPDAPEDQDKPVPKAVTEPDSGKSKVRKASGKKSKAAIEGQISLLGEAG